MRSFIKKCREEAGITQEMLAEKVNVSVTSVQNWEGGKTKIDQSRYLDLAAIFNVPVEKLIKEMMIEEYEKRPDRWPDFLFDDSTNDIINTLHLNLAQQDLFGLLYIYDAEYLKAGSSDRNPLEEDLKRIPYGFIEKVGSIRFMNQVDGLHNVLKYVDADFLMKVLKLNPDAEFNIRKLTKDQICEFIDHGSIGCDNGFWDPSTPEYASYNDRFLSFKISMDRSRIMLPLLNENGPVHLTDGRWSNPIRNDIPKDVLSGILDMCGFIPELWKEGYYEKKYNTSAIRSGLEKVTSFQNVAGDNEEEKWIWEINETGCRLLEWFQEKS